MKRRFFWIVLSFVAGLLVNLQFLISISKPTEADFLRTTTSHYFKKMSELGVAHMASYFDCRLIEPELPEQKQGIAKIGLCSSETEQTSYDYFVALKPSANVLFYELNEVSK